VLATDNFIDNLIDQWQWVSIPLGYSIEFAVVDAEAEVAIDFEGEEDR